MADTPADNVAATFQIAVATLVCTQYLGDGLGDRGLLGKYEFHDKILLT